MLTAMNYSVYIYFKVHTAHPQILQTIQLIQKDISKEGISARLLCGKDNKETWMEIYEGIADQQQFSQQLLRAIQKHASPEFKHLVRHEEWFQPIHLTQQQ